MRYHLTLARMATIKMSANNKYCRGCREKGTLQNSWWECKLVQPLWKIIFLKKKKKLKTALPFDPAIPPLGIFPEKKNCNLKRYMHPQCSQQHYLQQPGHGSNWSAHQQTTGLGRHDIYVYTHKQHNGILLRHNKEWNTVIYSQIGEPRKYTWWS